MSSSGGEREETAGSELVGCGKGAGVVVAVVRLFSPDSLQNSGRQEAG